MMTWPNAWIDICRLMMIVSWVKFHSRKFAFGSCKSGLLVLTLKNVLWLIFSYQKMQLSNETAEICMICYLAHIDLKSYPDCRITKKKYTKKVELLNVGYVYVSWRCLCYAAVYFFSNRPPAWVMHLRCTLSATVLPGHYLLHFLFTGILSCWSLFFLIFFQEFQNSLWRYLTCTPEQLCSLYTAQKHQHHLHCHAFYINNLNLPDKDNLKVQAGWIQVCIYSGMHIFYMEKFCNVLPVTGNLIC